MGKIIEAILIIGISILAINESGNIIDIPLTISIVTGGFGIIYGLWNIFIHISIINRNKVLMRGKQYKTTFKNSLEYYEKLAEVVLFTSFLCLLTIILIYFIVTNESHLFWSVFIFICIALCTVRACKNFIEHKNQTKLSDNKQL